MSRAWSEVWIRGIWAVSSASTVALEANVAGRCRKLYLNSANYLLLCRFIIPRI